MVVYDVALLCHSILTQILWWFTFPARPILKGWEQKPCRIVGWEAQPSVFGAVEKLESQPPVTITETMFRWINWLIWGFPSILGYPQSSSSYRTMGFSRSQKPSSDQGVPLFMDTPIWLMLCKSPEDLGPRRSGRLVDRSWTSWISSSPFHISYHLSPYSLLYIIVEVKIQRNPRIWELRPILFGSSQPNLWCLRKANGCHAGGVDSAEGGDSTTQAVKKHGVSGSSELMREISRDIYQLKHEFLGPSSPVMTSPQRSILSVASSLWDSMIRGPLHRHAAYSNN